MTQWIWVVLGYGVTATAVLAYLSILVLAVTRLGRRSEDPW